MEKILMSIPSRLEIIHNHKNSGGFVAAVLPIHYPRALFRAYNILPMEFWGTPQVQAGESSVHLQPNICPVAHNSLSFILGDAFDDVHMVIVPHVCDALQGLGTTLRDFICPQTPVLPFYIPRGKTENHVSQLAKTFRDLCGALGEITGSSVSETELMACVKREEEADGLLAELHKKRNFLPFNHREFYEFIRSREYLPAEIFISYVKEILNKVSIESQNRNTPIILSGIVPEPMELFEAVEGFNNFVAVDDLACCGRRLYPPGTSNDPFRRMAERILLGPPCSTRGSPIEERLAYLKNIVNETGAKGVIFFMVKFCDPELAGLPTLTKELQDMGVSCLILETDLEPELSQDTSMQIEIFLENLI